MAPSPPLFFVRKVALRVLSSRLGEAHRKRFARESSFHVCSRTAVSIRAFLRPAFSSRVFLGADGPSLILFVAVSVSVHSHYSTVHSFRFPFTCAMVRVCSSPVPCLLAALRSLGRSA